MPGEVILKMYLKIFVINTLIGRYVGDGKYDGDSTLQVQYFTSARYYQRQIIFVCQNWIETVWLCHCQPQQPVHFVAVEGSRCPLYTLLFVDVIYVDCDLQFCIYAIISRNRPGAMFPHNKINSLLHNCGAKHHFNFAERLNTFSVV